MHSLQYGSDSVKKSVQGRLVAAFNSTVMIVIGATETGALIYTTLYSTCVFVRVIGIPIKK
jgi:hypothetical protein